jgi:hypothetical protein
MSNKDKVMLIITTHIMAFVFGCVFTEIVFKLQGVIS